jgi:hypothetical protein
MEAKVSTGKLAGPAGASEGFDAPVVTAPAPDAVEYRTFYGSVHMQPRTAPATG